MKVNVYGLISMYNIMSQNHSTVCLAGFVVKYQKEATRHKRRSFRTTNVKLPNDQTGQTPWSNQSKYSLLIKLTELWCFFDDITIFVLCLPVPYITTFSKVNIRPVGGNHRLIAWPRIWCLKCIGLIQRYYTIGAHLLINKKLMELKLSSSSFL